MVKIFRCQNCKELKFFSKSELVDNKELCTFCANLAKEYRDEKRLIKESRVRERSSKKLKHFKEKERVANKKLKVELEKEKKKQKLKEKEVLAKKKAQEEKLKNAKKPGSFIVKKKLKVKGKLTKELEAEKLSEVYNNVLYVYATVKRIRAIEWRNQRSRVILNKEREVRHTHKGGWSQEKFQRFVKSKKKTALDWIEDNLSRKGVLRPPYHKVIVDSDKVDLKKGLEKVLDKKKLLY